jgi:hypothetical protein
MSIVKEASALGVMASLGMMFMIVVLFSTNEELQDVSNRPFEVGGEGGQDVGFCCSQCVPTKVQLSSQPVP